MDLLWGHRSCWKMCFCVDSSSQGCGSGQEPAPAWVFQGFTASFRAYPPALRWGPPWAAGLDTCFTVELHGLQQDKVLHQSSPQAAGESCSGTGALPTPSSLTLLYTGWLFLHFLTPLSCLLQLCQTFCPFLNTLSQRSCPRPWLAQHWPVLGLSCNRFCPDNGTFSGVISQKPSLQSISPCPQLPIFAT